MMSSGIDHCSEFSLLLDWPMHFRNRSLRHTCDARDEQKLEETNEFMKLVLLSNSPDRLSTSKYFSWGQDPLWFLTPATPLPPSPFAPSTALCQSIPPTFCQALSWMGPLLLPSFGVPRLPLCDGCTYRIFLCSTETQKSSPSFRPITHPSAMPCSLSS